MSKCSLSDDLILLSMGLKGIAPSAGMTMPFTEEVAAGSTLARIMKTFLVLRYK